MTALLLTTICFFILIGAIGAAARRRAVRNRRAARAYQKSYIRPRGQHEFLMGRHPGDDMRYSFWKHYGR